MVNIQEILEILEHSFDGKTILNEELSSVEYEENNMSIVVRKFCILCFEVKVQNKDEAHKLFENIWRSYLTVLSIMRIEDPINAENFVSLSLFIYVLDLYLKDDC